MATGKLYEIIDGVRRAKACFLAGRQDIPVEFQIVGREPEVIPIEELRARFGMIDASSSGGAKVRWDRAVVGSKIEPLPFPPILVSEISTRRASRLVPIKDVQVC